MTRWLIGDDTAVAGPPQLMMSFTADGQLDPQLVAQRDAMASVDSHARGQVLFWACSWNGCLASGGLSCVVMPCLCGEGVTCSTEKTSASRARHARHD